MTDEQAERFAGIMFIAGRRGQAMGAEAAADIAERMIQSTEEVTPAVRKVVSLARYAFEQAETRRSRQPQRHV